MPLDPIVKCAAGSPDPGNARTCSATLSAAAAGRPCERASGQFQQIQADRHPGQSGLTAYGYYAGSLTSVVDEGTRAAHSQTQKDTVTYCQALSSLAKPNSRNPSAKWFSASRPFIHASSARLDGSMPGYCFVIASTSFLASSFRPILARQTASSGCQASRKPPRGPTCSRTK
jgi:hypothetical protein